MMKNTTQELTIGEDCILHNDNEYSLLYGHDLIGKKVKLMATFECEGSKVAAVQSEDGCYCFNIDMLKPIDKKRNNMVELAMSVVDGIDYASDNVTFIEALYDAGMLKYKNSHT
jgi:hypothetical protein